MDMLVKVLYFGLIMAGFYLLLEDKAYAYLDPGTGSMIVQAIIAAVLGGLFTLKMFWHRIKGKFKKGSSTAGESNDGTHD